MASLVATNLSVRTDDSGRALLSDAHCEIRAGRLTALLGPNGAGKTTFLRAALGLLPEASGEMLLNSKPIATMRPPERARQVAYLPQRRPLAWPAAVEDVVALGRYGFGATLGKLQPEDQAAVDRAIDKCELGALRHRSCATLSGGELARVHCARAFAGETPLLIADEPTAALDPYHQFKIMDLFSAYVAQGGGALVVLHDVALAARYADEVILLANGEVTASGPTQDVLTATALSTLFSVEVRVNDGDVRFIPASTPSD